MTKAISPPTAQVIDLKPPVKSEGFFSRLHKAWGSLFGEDQAPMRSIYRLPIQPKNQGIPKPFPGVVPKSSSEKALAMDSAISAMTSFAYSAGAWDQGSFMGYALLAELSQITEFRKPAETLANEMTRKWGKLVSTSKDPAAKQKLAKLEEEMKKFNVKQIFNKALELDNFFGIGHIYIDVGTSGEELKQPLLMDKLKIAKGALKEFRTVEPMWTYPNLYNANDPLKKDFYDPQTWFVMGTEVHKSRMLRFISRPMPDMLKPSYLFGGISLTQLMWQYVENWLTTRQSVSRIISNFSTPVLQTDMDQMTTLQGAASLALRGNIYNSGRDNQGLLICDKEKEDFKIEAAPIAGLAELQNQAIEQLAFPSGLPLVKFLGVTPSGLNASSDGEIRVFYDTIAAAQEKVGTPEILKIIHILQLNTFGEIDPGIGWEWEELWELSEKEQAEVQKTEAETDMIYVEGGILDPQAVLDKIIQNPNSPYSGLNLSGELPEQPMLGMEGGEEGEEGLTQALGNEGPKQLINRAVRQGRGPAGSAEEDDALERRSQQRPDSKIAKITQPAEQAQLALMGTREQERGRER